MSGLTCTRCEQLTGNNNQGHYWAWCKSTGQLEGFHFCCPNLPCELPEGGRHRASDGPPPTMTDEPTYPDIQLDDLDDEDERLL